MITQGVYSHMRTDWQRTHKGFDRKTFNPRQVHSDRKTLTYLRQAGNRRSWLYSLPQFKNGSRGPVMSTCLSELWDFHSKTDTVLDIGCGDSGDRIIANDWGCRAVGLDLFAPDNSTKDGFIRGDAVSLPFSNCSIDLVVCYAMIDLLKPDERLLFYAEVARVITVAGFFAFAGLSLANGWGFKRSVELQSIRNAGFHYITGTVWQKCDQDYSCDDDPYIAGVQRYQRQG